jgi:hypothetical protein
LRPLPLRRSGGLKPGPLLEGGYCFAEAWRLGGIARAATDPLPQARQLGRQDGVLIAELMILQLLSKNELTDNIRP